MHRKPLPELLTVKDYTGASQTSVSANHSQENLKPKFEVGFKSKSNSAYIARNIERQRESYLYLFGALFLGLQ